MEFSQEEHQKNFFKPLKYYTYAFHEHFFFSRKVVQKSREFLLFLHNEKNKKKNILVFSF